MGDDGVKPICEALKQNSSLKVLDLNASNTRGEEIGPQGAQYLADMLSVNGGLTVINLSGNQLCGIWTDWRGQHGTYTAEGITCLLYTSPSPRD